MRRFMRATYRILRGTLAFYGLVWAALTMIAIFAVVELRDVDAIDLTLDCGDPCVIKDNPGGSVYLFQLAADNVLKGKRKQVIIDGSCVSACAFFADKARPRVCITQKAVFRFHKGYIGDDGRIRMTIHHSHDVEGWVVKRGGYPANGFLDMPFAEAKKFWPVCRI